MHLCSHCGSATRMQQVIPEQSILICPKCHREDEFKCLPLFVVAGGGGSGKTSVSFRLTGHSDKYLVFDVDLIGPMKHESNEAACSYMIWMCRMLAQNGIPIVPFCWSNLSHCETSPDIGYFSAVHYLVLAPNAEVQEKRLRGRSPRLREEPDSEEFIAMSLAATEILVSEAESLSNATVLDTSTLTVDQTVNEVHRWILERL